MEQIPLGAVGIYTATQKIRTGLQQLMAGSRNFHLSTITRKDLMSLSEECEKVTGIPYVMLGARSATCSCRKTAASRLTGMGIEFIRFGADGWDRLRALWQ